MNPRIAFLLFVLIVGLVVTGIWWAIFENDPTLFLSSDCRAAIESTQDIIVKGCLDWGEVASTMFSITVYGAILIGLPTVAIAVARSMWKQGE